MSEHHPGALKEIAQRRGAFTVAFAGIFVVLFGFLSLVGMTPDVKKTDTASSTTTSQPVSSQPTLSQSNITSAAPSVSPESPVRVAAPDIGLDVKVSNPVATDIPTLDEALLTGSVRYPTSALLGTDGTVLLFGHSSYLPVVRNQAYKAFDGIQNLKVGQIVSVYSATAEYRYSVTSVRVANADNAVIELVGEGKHLKLVTCDSFASKSHRFVVSADFVGEYPLR